VAYDALEISSILHIAWQPGWPRPDCIMVSSESKEINIEAIFQGQRHGMIIDTPAWDTRGGEAGGNIPRYRIAKIAQTLAHNFQLQLNGCPNQQLECPELSYKPGD